MPVTNEVIAPIDAKLEVHRRFNDREEDKMRHQRDLLEAQLQFAATLQADLDALRVILQSAAPFSTTATSAKSNRHDQGRASGK